MKNIPVPNKATNKEGSYMDRKETLGFKTAFCLP